MLKRIISAAVGITFMLGVIISSTFFPFVIDIFVALVCLVGIYEFSRATKTLSLFSISIPSMAFAFAFPLLISFHIGYLVWYVYSAVMLTMLIFNHKKINYRDFAALYGMTLIITVALSSIILVKAQDVLHSTIYFVLSLGIPWVADAGAYFVGVYLGKHKLCPEISPQKTIEGAVGGVVTCVAVVCFAAWLFSTYIFTVPTEVNYFNLIVMASSASVLSILGDLSFSLVKRAFSVKDYGNLIPGHGGVLDRFDSVIFVAPLIYLLVSVMPIINL